MHKRSQVKPGGVSSKVKPAISFPHHADSPLLFFLLYLYTQWLSEKPFPFLPLKGNIHTGSQAEFGVQNLCRSITMELISFMCD